MPTRSKKRRRKHSPKKVTEREDGWADASEAPGAQRSKAAFMEYYRHQLLEGGVLRDEADWDAFVATMERPLPVTFRFTAEPALARRLEGELEAALSAAAAEAKSTEDDLVVTGSRLPWMEGGWRLSTDKNALRKCKSASYQKLRAWMNAIADAGSLTRQEQVSMVPPLLLQAEPGDRVLDSCAAPGSKTSQLMEAVTPKDVNRTLPTTSVIVANDESLPRAHTLVHQVKRLTSPNWLATHHDARRFPKVAPLFDKVLCDVPCSGDGTMRKTPTIIWRWSCHQALALHALQLDIATRGAKLLAPGGRLVYSTCALNPVENEAVVAQLLRLDPQLFVVDMAKSHQHLKRRPGLVNWRVFDDKKLATTTDPLATETKVPEEEKNTSAAAGPETDASLLREYDSAGEVEGRDIRRLRPTLFPPTEEHIREQLVRCMRFLPQDDDSGAFFVAVLEKKKDDNKEILPDSTPDKEEGPQKASVKKPMPEDAAFVELAKVYDVSSLVEFFDLDKTFPADRLLSRADTEGEASKRIMLVSTAAKDLILAGRLRVVQAGVVVFQRTSQSSDLTTVPFRIAQEGVNFLLSFMGPKRKITCSPADFRVILKGGSIGFEALSPSLVTRILPLDIGSLVFVLDSNTEVPAIVTWRGDGNFVVVYCGKPDLLLLKSRVASILGETALATEENDDANDDDDHQNNNGDDDEENNL